MANRVREFRRGSQRTNCSATRSWPEQRHGDSRRRVFKTPEGPRIGSPEIARRYDPDGRWTSSRAFNFPDQADWVRFSDAAIAAIEHAFPGAFAHPDTTTTTKD